MAEIRKHNRSLTREQAFAQSVLSDNTGTVYYTTDSHTIIMNGVEYSKSDLKNLEGYFTDDNAKFNYRSTAGSQSVASQANGDLATIEALYGDSLVWNQLVHTTSFTNTKVDTESTRYIQIQYKTTSDTTAPWTGGDAGGVSNVVDNTYYSWRKTAPADANGYWRIKVNGITVDTQIIRTEGWKEDGISVDAIIPNHVYYIRLHVKTCDSTTVGGVNIDNIQVFDLSLMFGLGNEPTLAEFETFLANYFPRKDYAYNEGEVLSIKSNGIKTVGFNLWDEEWEVGAITYAKGDNYSITDRIRSKNYVRVLGNTTYNFVTTKTARHIWFYNANKELITEVNGSNNYITLPVNSSTFTTPKDACYLRFVVYVATYGSTYNHDITINLAWSGNRNGEYEEHWSETTPIPITTLEGTKSDGTREVMFPDGLCGIDDYKDEIKGNKAIKRIGKVDLGSLNWSLENADYGIFVAPLAHLHGGWDNISLLKSSKYPTTSPSQAALTGNKTIRHSGGYNSVRIQDSSYTDAATLKASLQGVYAYYVLGSEIKATPIEYTLDQDFKVDYKVDDYGTEEILPENGTAPTSLPLLADIRYGINAVDTLARLHKDYVSVYPQSFNDEQKEQARKNIGANDTLDGNSLDFGVVQNGDGSIDLDLDVSTIGGESKQKTIELPVATPNHNGLMSKEDKALLGNHTTALANDEARLDALDKTYETQGEFGFRHSGGSDIYDVNAGVGKITRLVGNSVNWHQLAPELTSENYAPSTPAYTSLTFSTEQGRKIVTLTALQDISSGNSYFNLKGLLGDNKRTSYPVPGHYYLWTMDVWPSVEMRFGVGTSNTNIENVTVSKTNGYTRIYGRSYANGSGSCILRTTSAVPQGATLKVKDIQMYDLTMMFGQGKEPTTAQMKTWLETYHRRYDYAREEKIIGFDPKEIVTQGSNLIFDNATVLFNPYPQRMDVLYKGDEITVKINTVGNNYIGKINTEDVGTTIHPDLWLRCIRVQPNTKYRVSLDGEDADKVWRIFYNFLDATYKLLDVSNGMSYYHAPASNLYFTTSEETYYVKIRLDFRNAGTNDYLDVGTYTFRVSLHKEGDGNKNDVVEKYWKKTKALTAPSTLKREDGSLIFPDGLMAIGDYHDEIVDGKAIKRIVKVDLGTLDWTKVTGNNEVRFYTKVQDSEDTVDTGNIYGVICSKYTTTTYNQNYSEAVDAVEKTIFITRGYYHLFIHDTTYDGSTAAEFKAAMNGVYAYYVLNDPEVIEIGDVYDDAYQVDPYGTEMMCDDANGNVDCYGTTKVKYGVDTAKDTGNLLTKPFVEEDACVKTWDIKTKKTHEADLATADEEGNNIITTYAKKSDVQHYLGRTNQYAPVSVDRNTWIGINDGVVAGFYRLTANEYLIAQDGDVLLDYGGNPYLFYNGQWRAMFVNVASRALLGKVKIGSNLNITEDGVISVDTSNIATRDYVDTSINAIPLATTSQKGLLSSTDKQSLDLNNTPMRLMVLQDQRNSTYNLCVSVNAARFIDAGYKPVIYRRMKVKRHFAFNDAFTRVWKWIPCEEVVLTSLQTSGQQSEYMKIGVPNLLQRKHIVVDTDTIYIGGSDIPISDWLNALGVWNYGSPSHLDDNNSYYAAKDFVIESCPDYIVDYSQSTHDYSQTGSYVYAHHGAARKTLYAGGSALKPFKITLQYGFAFVEDSDITSKRVTDIIPFQLVHTPLENVSYVTSNNKYARWKFRLR